MLKIFTFLAIVLTYVLCTVLPDLFEKTFKYHQTFPAGKILFYTNNYCKSQQEGKQTTTVGFFKRFSLESKKFHLLTCSF